MHAADRGHSWHTERSSVSIQRSHPSRQQHATHASHSNKGLVLRLSHVPSHGRPDGLRPGLLQDGSPWNEGKECRWLANGERRRRRAWSSDLLRGELRLKYPSRMAAFVRDAFLRTTSRRQYRKVQRVVVSGEPHTTALSPPFRMWGMDRGGVEWISSPGAGDTSRNGLYAGIGPRTNPKKEMACTGSRSKCICRRGWGRSSSTPRSQGVVLCRWWVDLLGWDDVVHQSEQPSVLPNAPLKGLNATVSSKRTASDAQSVREQGWIHGYMQRRMVWKPGKDQQLGLGAVYETERPLPPEGVLGR